MTEEELRMKQKEEFLRYAMAEKEAHDAKKLYDKWCIKMLSFLAGMALGISVAVLLYN